MSRNAAPLHMQWSRLLASLSSILGRLAAGSILVASVPSTVVWANGQNGVAARWAATPENETVAT
jgi:hypothetical protein